MVGSTVRAAQANLIENVCLGDDKDCNKRPYESTTIRLAIKLWTVLEIDLDQRFSDSLRSVAITAASFGGRHCQEWRHEPCCRKT